MLRLFDFVNGKLVERKFDRSLLDQAVSHTSWVDAQDTSDEERDRLELLLHTELPESDDVEEIESSARYFTDGSGIHVHSMFLSQSEGRLVINTVAFILQPTRLITVREAELADFRLLRMRALRGQIEAHNPKDLLLTMLEQKVENLADTIEDIYLELEKVSHSVLEDQNAELEEAIENLALLEDSNGKIRMCLMDTQRSISFLQRQLRDSPSVQEVVPEIMRDIDTLMSHTNFMFEKINFLMDAAQGFINIEQNKIINIFSIASVVFLPPTLVASIYGMNFVHMPELQWLGGYPLALGMMILAGIAPYLYFKRKNWL